VIRTVPVHLAGRAYDVVIGHGLLAEAGRRIRPLLKRDRVAIVSDETVWTESMITRAGLTSSM